MIDIYTFDSHRIGAIFDILPKATTNPSGSENTSVSTKISVDVIIPPHS